MNDIDKLRVLLPHWIEHNHSHEAEFKKWADIMQKNDAPDIALLIEKAISNMKNADTALAGALEKIGGPLEDKNGHHHHHH